MSFLPDTFRPQRFWAFLVPNRGSVQLSSCSRALLLPELVRFIGKFSTKRDLASLLRSSRRSFACVSPILWEDVDMMCLLLLIPGVTCSKHTEERLDRVGTEYKRVFVFPRIADTSRLQLYSHLVKVVRTAIPYVLDFSDGWPFDNLSSPWLPNLQHLVINTYGSIPPSQFEWTHRLLTPSLLSFEMYSIDLNRSSGEDSRSEHSWLSPKTCSELLDSMAVTCTWINTLQIFPAAVSSSSETIYHSRILSGIARLTRLSVLALGTTNLDQELFDVLGQLSHLEVLTLHNDGSQPIPGENSEIRISNDLFPSLRQLEFRGIDDLDVQRIDGLSSLFGQLTKAAIIFLDDGFYEEQTNHCLRSGLALHCIGTNSLRLVDLTLFTPWNHAYFAIFIPGALDVFRQMPLRRLRLGGVRLQSWPDTVGLDTNILTRPYGDLHLEVHWRDFLLAVS